jgi:hypothetical protein
MRQRVVKALKPLDAWSVENPCRPGTPDVNYIEGWIELKWLDNWPKRSSTVVRLDHFTPQQRLHLARRWNLGGNAYLLLQVGQDWLLFNGEEAAKIVGKVPKSELEEACQARWHRPDLATVLPPQLRR